MMLFAGGFLCGALFIILASVFAMGSQCSRVEEANADIHGDVTRVAS